MRITRRDVAVKAAVTCLSILAFFVLRRGLLVIFLALKIFGHTSALDAWRGRVHQQTVEHAGIPIDIYAGEHSYSPLLIVHGVNPSGKNSLDLMRISQALAQAGYQVFVPDFVEMRKQHLRAEEAAHIKSVFQFIGKDAGIACFSYGCGPTMVAAADPDISSHVRFALTFGGYFDIRETLEYVVTGPESPIVYLKWIYLGANSDLVADEGDRVRLQTIAANGGEGRLNVSMAASLAPDARALLDIFSALSPESFRERLNSGPESLRRRLDALSPSRFIKGLHAPLILVHGINDPAIPSQQSIEFSEAARANGLDCSLTLLRMYGHTHPVLPDVGLASFFGFYLPEMSRFLGVVNRLVGMM